MEHALRISQFLARAPVVVAVDALQLAAVGEHADRIGKVLDVETRDIDFLQRRATGEHELHVCAYRGVQVLQPFNGLEILELEEHITQIFGGHAHHRFVKHYFGNFMLLVIGKPIG